MMTMFPLHQDHGPAHSDWQSKKFESKKRGLTSMLCELDLNPPFKRARHVHRDQRPIHSPCPPHPISQPEQPSPPAECPPVLHLPLPDTAPDLSVDGDFDEDMSDPPAYATSNPLECKVGQILTGKYKGDYFDEVIRKAIDESHATPQSQALVLYRPLTGIVRPSDDIDESNNLCMDID
eukprot:c5684_g1_i1.p1 GENE.c5684_g1_i1~~c5684_g1_i1.p1  ORF type:complete len:179 (+),score=25.48 c5684_g1_i1:97-633(+)